MSNTVRMRVLADADATRHLIHALESLAEIERVEEVQDLTPHADDADSSSAGLHDTRRGVHAVEAEAPDERGERRVRETARRTADRLGIGVEFVDRF